MPDLTGILIAAGRSQRMGQPKQLLPWPAHSRQAGGSKRLSVISTMRCEKPQFRLPLGFVVLIGLLPVGTLFVCSLGLYRLTELFPELIRATQLKKIPHFARLERFVPDRDLVFCHRRGTTREYEFQGDLYSPAYGIPVETLTNRVTYDADGFRNDASRAEAEVVVISVGIHSDESSHRCALHHRRERGMVACGKTRPDLSAGFVRTSSFGDLRRNTAAMPQSDTRI